MIIINKKHLIEGLKSFSVLIRVLLVTFLIYVSYVPSFGVGGGPGIGKPVDPSNLFFVMNSADSRHSFPLEADVYADNSRYYILGKNNTLIFIGGVEANDPRESVEKDIATYPLILSRTMLYYAGLGTKKGFTLPEVWPLIKRYGLSKVYIITEPRQRVITRSRR